jgi:hypothetical protein
VQLVDPGPEEYDLPGAPPPTSSATMAAHARDFVADILAREWVGPGRILEMASHGGYLQPFFAEAGVRTCVLEGDAARADRLRQAGHEVIAVPLDEAPRSPEVRALGPVSLVVDHFLLAHLPDPDRALAAIAALLAPDGMAVLEFDHLQPTIEGGQFDAFRHGHRSYVSLTWLAGALDRHGLVAMEARSTPVYGGSARVVVRRGGRTDQGPSATRMLAAERMAGLGEAATYERFATRVQAGREAVRRHLRDRASAGLSCAAYGAPARATTLLNYYSLGPELLAFTADASPAKQGRAIPGIRLPIRSPEELRAARPSEVLVLTWDIAAEVIAQLEAHGSWGARYLVPVPHLREVPVAA